MGPKLVEFRRISGQEFVPKSTPAPHGAASSTEAAYLGRLALMAVPWWAAERLTCAPRQGFAISTSRGARPSLGCGGSWTRKATRALRLGLPLALPCACAVGVRGGRHSGGLVLRHLFSGPDSRNSERRKQ